MDVLVSRGALEITVESTIKALRDELDQAKRKLMRMENAAKAARGIPGAHLRFVLDRREDQSGLSGTGIVAEGIAFSNGKVVVSWLGALGVPSTAVFDSLAQVSRVHGHDGRTLIVFLDEMPRAPKEHRVNEERA